MREFVLVLIVSGGAGDEETVLVIQKDRPDWQKGKLNLPGGKIEDGETPEEAAIRELKEESGLDAARMELKGKMMDRDLAVYCMEAHGVTGDWLSLKGREGETEKVFWMRLKDAYADNRLMPNLRVIIPLMRSRQNGWLINDCGGRGYGDGKTHTISVTVPNHN